MKAKDVMTREVATTDKDERLETVLETMRKRGVSKLVVLEKGQLAGIVTTGDIADELGAIKNRGVAPSHLHASSAMRRSVPTCAPETPLAEASKLMLDEDMPLLPVVHDRSVVGVLTMSDLVKRVQSTKPLADVMSDQVHVVQPTERVVHARRLMIDHHVERLPVLDEGKVVGILGESDVAYGFARFKSDVRDRHQGAAIQRFLVEDLYRQPAVTIGADATAKDAALTMARDDVGCLPVLRGDRLAGIVTRSDLVPLASL